jgi:hypothetical protein
LERLARDKHSSLLRTFVNYGHKKFYKIGSRQNLAKIEIYIKDPYVSLYLTEEKITEMAFVGSIGGVLGLFLGFSFISSFEIIFLVTTL